jgi:hypothetical protein
MAAPNSSAGWHRPSPATCHVGAHVGAITVHDLVGRGAHTDVAVGLYREALRVASVAKPQDDVGTAFVAVTVVRLLFEADDAIGHGAIV